MSRFLNKKLTDLNSQTNFSFKEFPKFENKAKDIADLKDKQSERATSATRKTYGSGQESKKCK